MRIISPSLLSADFSNLKNEILKLESAGANRLHLDVMDGHFVPSITFGPMVIKAIRKITNCHLETHLMIENPHLTYDQYIEAGSNTIIFHIESSIDPKKDIKYIKNKNILAGLALNPDTDEILLKPFIEYLDYILIMSVHPGKGGQDFIHSTLKKIDNIASMCKNKNITIGVDGGVNLETISKVYSTKVDITIVGSGLFRANNISKRFNELLNV